MRKEKRERGQSTIEFIFSFFFILVFVFLFIRISMNYTAGFLVHYATFMSSRAYLVYDDNSDTAETTDSRAEEEATKVFEAYKTNLFLNISSGPSLVFNAPTQVGYTYIGAYSEYSQKFGMSMLGTGELLRFRSESFLGREPTKTECAVRVCEAMEMMGIDQACDPGDQNVTLYDNGC